jgi:Subtilase family/Secretion system C-terminal sorting domain
MNIKLKLLLFFCNMLFLQKQSFSQINKYIQLGFTNKAYIPKSTIVGTFKDQNGKTWNKYHLDCHDPKMTNELSKYSILEFEQEFPLATKFNHQYSDLLSRVYKIRIIQNVDIANANIKSINSSDIEGAFVTGDPISLTETNPNDYNPSNHSNNRFYASINKSLDLINAKGAWQYTRGNENIVIGISDANFKHDNDIDSKALNLNTFSSYTILPTTSQAFSHGLAVTCLAAAITDNDIGVASIGNKVSVRYYDIGNYNSMLQAALDGCKVINCSWFSLTSNSTQPPITGDYNQKVIDLIYDHQVTIVAAAGNCNTGGNCSDYFYPASYNHVISVTSVGCTYDLGHIECFKIGGVATKVGVLVKDQHECVAGYPNGYLTNCDFGYVLGYNNVHQHNNRVDICAPGYNVLINRGKSLNGKDFNTGDWGTSFASPQVAGAVALIYSLNPHIYPAEVETILKESAADISNVSTNYLYAGKIGAGRLDAGAACKLINNTDIACMHRVDDIDWFVSGNKIKNDDYWQFVSPITFSIAPSGVSETYEWEFVSGNEVVKKTTTVPYVDLDFHSEFTTFIGAFIREEKLPLEVYVRRRDIKDLDCFSAFYKESGINANVAGGNTANNGPYPSNNCDGNIYFNYPTILSGDYKAANIYIGSDFAGTSVPLVQSSDVAETNTMAANQIIMLPGTNIKRPSNIYTFFRSFINDHCSIPNRWRLAGGSISNEAIPKPEPTNIFIDNPNSLRAYPNPIINTLNLDFYSSKKDKAIIYVVDINGKTLKEIIVNITVGMQKITIDTRSLTKGVYTVKVMVDNKQLLTKVLKP